MAQPRVSVIIPAWNAEHTLEACLRSIMEQSFHDIEIIIVDDGSTDGTWALLQHLAAQDARLRPIRQENSGVSAARNAGLDAATGEFIRFVDADDVLPPEGIAALLRSADEADLVLAGYTEVVGSLRHTRGLHPSGGTQTLPIADVLRHLCRHSNSFYYGVLWNKLFRAELIRRGNVRFVSGLNWGEDFVFVCDYLARVQRVCYTDVPVYDYQRNTDGMTAHQLMDCLRHPLENIRMKVDQYHVLKQLYQNCGAYPQYRHKLWLYLFRVTLNN